MFLLEYLQHRRDWYLLSSMSCTCVKHLRTNMVLVGSSKSNGLLGLKLFDHIMAPLVSLIEIFSTSPLRNLSKMYKKTRARQMIF